MTENNDTLFLKNIENIIDFRLALNSETDRGCALMAASFLENEIAVMLKSNLVGTESFKKALFEFNGPLGTFSSRIKMAFALGFISRELMNDLDLVRKIRNEFGHKYQPIDFKSIKISSQIKNLKHSLYTDKSTPERTVFINCVVNILAFIHSGIEDKKFREKKPSAFSDEEKNTLREVSLNIAQKIVDEK